MKTNRGLCIGILAVLLTMNSGCAVLGQFIGEADISGRVIMPDGTPAKDVDLIVNYIRIVHAGIAGIGDADFWDKVHSKDGTFHLRYNDVLGVTVVALKPGWRSYHYDFRKDLRAAGVVIELRPVGEYPDQRKLDGQDYSIKLDPDAKAGGMKFGDRGGLYKKIKLRPVEEADFYVERAVLKKNGRKTEGLLFKVCEGFGLHVVEFPPVKLPKYAKAQGGWDLTLAPEGGYDTHEIPLLPKPQEIWAFFRTPDGKYGKLVIWGCRSEPAGEKTIWEVNIGYFLNPDGSRNLDTYQMPFAVQEKGDQKK
jgi:hypothetical protein